MAAKSIRQRSKRVGSSTDGADTSKGSHAVTLAADDDRPSVDGTDASGSEADESESDDLDALFEASIEAMRKREADEASKRDGDAENFEANEDVIRLVDDDAEKASQSKDSKADPKHPQRKDKRKGVAASSRISSEKQLDAAFDRLRSGDDVGENRPKSKRAQQKERRQEEAKTAGGRWFDMPAFPSDPKKQKDGKAVFTNPNGEGGDHRGPSAAEMRREVQAIRLRNAIDPKRFYRGSSSNDKDMPKFAQLGRIISSNTAPASTLNRSERGRTVIDELVRDSEAVGYAKRKFDEQQQKSNVGWSSHVRRFAKKGAGGSKRQRR